MRRFLSLLFSLRLLNLLRLRLNLLLLNLLLNLLRLRFNLWARA